MQRYMASPEGIPMAKAVIAEAIAQFDELARLESARRAAVRTALARERDSDPAAIDLCLAGFEYGVREMEPYARRLYAASVTMLQTKLPVLDGLAAIQGAIGQFGSADRVPRSDPRMLALQDAVTRSSLADEEKQRAQDALAAFRRVKAQALDRDLSKLSPSR
jgi:hypothetical protein